MLTKKEIGKVNSKIAQLKTVFDTVMIKSSCNMKFYFEKIKHINYQVIATQYLLSHHAKWVGRTALHFAADKLKAEVFDILLELNADFTMKNSSGSTALHCMMEECPELIDIYVESFLSAHIQTKNFQNLSNANGLSHFHIACAANKVELVQRFLDSGVHVDHAVKMDAPIFHGFTPLHFASKYCAFEVAEVLLSHNANVRAKDAKEMTSLHVALDRRLTILDDIDFDESLVDEVEKILKMFIEKESNDDMMTIDEWGLSHFHVACTLKDSKIAVSYVQKVIDINHAVNVDSPLWAGYTALHFAALCNIDTVKLLMKKGADISIRDIKGVSPFDICIENYKTEDIYAVICLNPIWRNIMLSDGRTRLTDLVFAMRNSNQFSMFLRKLSKNFNIYDSPLWSGFSPMHLAVIFTETPSDDDEDTNIQILKNLCQYNPSMVYSKDVHGYTPLHLAFRLRKKPALNVLFNFLETFPHLLDQVDEDGLTYLHISSAKNKTNVLIGLLATDINVNSVYTGKTLVSPKVYSGSTALHLAVLHGSSKAVDTLLKRGADVYAKNANGMTPIHLTLLTMNNKSAATLLSSPNLRDSVVRGTGLSHLHVACLCGQREHVESLLNNGADINAVVTYEGGSGELRFLEKYAGHSLLFLAYVRNKHSIVDILLQRGAKIFLDNAREIELLYTTFESKFDDPSNKFVKTLGYSDFDLIIRLKADTGMTMLHVACFELNVDKIEQYIGEGVDVNVQIRSDSPIFQRYTSLHILMRVCKNMDEDVGTKLMELFVASGADVTLQSGKSETAVHMAYKTFRDLKSELNYLRLNVLLEAQRDFSHNPTSVEGISHVHVACSVCNVGIVEKFLSQGVIDINQPIDYFYENEAGYSPLHLAAGSHSDLCGAWKQLPTIDLLLKNGADVHAEDAHADTPLHECARFGSLDIFERLVRAGADVNAENIRCNTPFSNYLGSYIVSAEGIKTLLRFGCDLNVFDVFDDEGCLGLIVSKLPYADVQKLVSALIVNFESKLEMNNLGRTAIHNVVSADPPSTSGYQYAELIDKLAEIGCDVDTLDHLGRTALHLAVQFHNFQAISGLLMAGADINANGVDGEVFYKFDDTCFWCIKYHYKIIEDSDEEDENEENDDEGNMCKHIEAIKTLAIHVKKLQMCGLDVIKKNEDLARDTFEWYKIKTEWGEEFLRELEIIKKTRIGSHSLTLHDFLSENGVVADYPTMSQMKREDINKFFSPSEVLSLRGKFPEIAGILQLQYRKARARPQLVETAKNAMGSLIGFRLPEICSHFIMALLKNSDLKNLIASTT